MTRSFTREDVAAGSVRFTVTPGENSSPSGVPIPAIAGAVVSGLILASLLHWIIGVAGGWGVFQYLKGRTQKSSAPNGLIFSFVASADSLTTGGGR
jgi:hypothetical protein